MIKKCISAVCLLLCLAFCLLLLPACQKSDPLAQSGFASLTLDAKKQKVHATVTLDARTLQKAAGTQLLLYELTPGKSIGAQNQEPIAQAKAAATVHFSFDLYDGDRSRLYSSFVIGLEDGSFLNPNGYYIENPEALASNTDKFLWNGSPKGLWADDTHDAADLGAMHVMYEVRLSDLTDGESTHRTGSYSVSFDPSYLLSLDQRVKSSAEAGLQVSLNITFDLNLNGQSCAAVFDLLASHYMGAENGTVTAFFLDFSEYSSELPAQEQDAHLASYSALLCRLANQALRARVANGRVYVSFSGKEPDITLKALFSNLQATLSAGGKLEWGAAISTSLSQESDTAIGDLLPSADALSSLSDLLLASSTPGHASWFAVNSFSCTASTEGEQAAALAYLYRIAAASKASLIFYAEHMHDRAGLRNGDGSERAALSVFEQIDSGLQADNALLCESLLGEAWSGLKSTPSTHLSKSGSASAGTSGFAENVLFDFHTGETYGFCGVGSLDAPTSRDSAVFNAPVLYTWLDPTQRNAAGVRKVFSDGSKFENAISLSAQFLTQAKDVQICRARLCLQGVASDGSLLTYESEIEVTNGKWQTVTFQISGFVSEADLSRPCVMTLTTEPQGGSADKYVLWLRGINVRYPEQDYGTAMPLILILGGAVLGFLGVLVIHRISSRKRRRRSV